MLVGVASALKPLGTTTQGWPVRLLNNTLRPVADGAKLLPAHDPSWYFCYDDGMTPAEAVAEARRKGIV